VLNFEQSENQALLITALLFQALLILKSSSAYNSFAVSSSAYFEIKLCLYLLLTTYY
jgi:hypothetical protein